MPIANFSAGVGAVPTTPSTPSAPSGVDRQALNLTHAIALTESGSKGKPNYNAVGDNGTSTGAYQWHGAGHFASDAKAAGLDPNDFSPKNQDQVAYAKVKQLKDQGKQPAEIASIWNSGQPQNYENHSGVTNINGQMIHYDTPAYVQKVKQYYTQLNGTYNPAPFSSGAVNLSSNKSDDGGTIEQDYPGKGIVDFAHGLIEPELKAVASGSRALLATPKLIDQFKNTNYSDLNLTKEDLNNPVMQELQKPVLGQKTMAGSTTDENLGSAANAGTQLLALKLPDIVSSLQENGIKKTLQQVGSSKAVGLLRKALAVKGVYDATKDGKLSLPALLEIAQEFYKP